MGRFNPYDDHEPSADELAQAAANAEKRKEQQPRESRIRIWDSRYGFVQQRQPRTWSVYDDDQQGSLDWRYHGPVPDRFRDDD